MSLVRANAILAFFGIVTALLLAEGFLRLVGYSHPSFHTIDTDLGSALRPHAEGMWVQEGRAYVRISSDGLRDIEHQIGKPSGIVRIAILGDSYAEGLQLPIEKLFWKVLEEKLNGCLVNGIKAEAINFGVSGYGTGHELLMFRKKVQEYEPDVVILAFLTGNDISDNSRILSQVDYAPYFEISDGQLVLDKSYLHSEFFRARSGWLAQIMYRYINHVRLLQLVNAVRHRWHIQRLMHKRNHVQKGQEDIGLDNAIYRPPTTRAWRDAWKVTEALILTLNKEVAAMGARLFVVTLSNDIQVHPDRKLRQRFMEELGVTDLFYPDRRVVALAKQNGIDALMLAPDLRAWAERNGTCVHGFKNADACGGHWNKHGHRVAAELLAQKMCTEMALWQN